MLRGLYFPQKPMHQFYIHGHQGDNNTADNRGYREDGTRGHNTGPQGYPPYHIVNGTHPGHTTCSTQPAAYPVLNCIKYYPNT